jgi:hypothetical protein
LLEPTIDGNSEKYHVYYASDVLLSSLLAKPLLILTIILEDNNDYHPHFTDEGNEF